MHHASISKHVGSTYDEIATKYADAQDSKPWNIYFERPAILQFLPDVRGKDVYDAGCGPGFYSHFMMDQGAHVTASDLNPVFVERTRQRVGQDTQVFQADLAEPLTFAADQSFDLVICILVMHYLEDWRPTLSEFHRILRPNGELIISTYHPFTDLELSQTGDYFATELLEDEWEVGKVQFYRRPLSKITQDILLSGFAISELAEPQPIQPPADLMAKWYHRSMKTPRRLLVRSRKVS